MLKQTSYKNLYSKQDRVLAKIALIARNDVIFGGAKALVIARRLNNMGTDLPVDDVVCQAYHSSNGDAIDYLPYVCPECGSVCLGQDATYNHCQNGEND